MTQQELLYDYLMLDNYKKTIPPVQLVDIRINDLTILRKTSDGYRIYYFQNGYCIYIPWNWINLFSSFNTHSGYQSNYISIQPDSNNLDKLIYYFTLFINFINREKFKDALKTLSIIFEIGTSELRDWLKEKNIDITLEKIVFSSVNNEIIL
jgi:hypothetical protein